MSHMKAIVLAAGKGTRLQTDGVSLPKVMRPACGKPLLSYVLHALDFIPSRDIIIVIGYRKEDIVAAFSGYVFAEQAEQLGTGHAVMSAAAALDGYSGPVLVCCGDMPLMRKGTYEELIQTHLQEGNACTLLSGTAEEALPYGRIQRNPDGSFRQVVEEKDCTPEQKEIRELNAGVYVFDTQILFSVLPQLKRSNAQGEYYLTDAPAFIQAAGGKVGICSTCSAGEMLGVNTQSQLSQVEDYIKAHTL